MKVFLGSATLIILSLLPVCVSGGPAESQSDQPVAGGTGDLREYQGTAGRFGGRHRFGWGFDRRTTPGRSMFRQSFMDELKHCPTLDGKVRALLNLQRERVELYQRLGQAARRTDLPSSELWRDFHDLLKQRDEMSTRQLELTEQFASDSDTILREIDSRRETLREQLSSSETPVDDPSQSRLDTGEVSRLLRMYDFIYDRIRSLRDEPRRAGWLRGFQRGLWRVDDLDSQIVENVRRRLQQIEHDKEEMSRRLYLLENEIEELREMLDVAGSEPRKDRKPRRQWRPRRRPSRPARPANSQ
jgi:hypothetical protein